MRLATTRDDEPLMEIPELVPIGDIEPAEYNPREADPHRLDLIKISLTKLGFILPLYARPDGRILSGHKTYCCLRARADARTSGLH